MPETLLDQRYSNEHATEIPWNDARQRLADAGVYWLSTVRPDGRPHVTPLIAIWLDDALLFCTGPEERKARNLEGNANVVVTTGTDALDRGVDVVVEGEAVTVRDGEFLERAADAWAAKYGEGWRFEVRDGAFHHQGGTADVFRVRPKVVFGFGKDPYSQVRYTF